MQDIEDVVIIPVRDEAPSQEPTGDMNTLTISSENLRDEVTKMVQLKYENRREFYECPFEDYSIPSWTHFIAQRDGDLKKFNKSLDNLLKKCRGHKLESIASDAKFQYRFKLEGIDRCFEF